MLSSVSNIHLVNPQHYLPFVYLMDRAELILTDSGGVQEEAPSLGKPVLVMRRYDRTAGSGGSRDRGAGWNGRRRDYQQGVRDLTTPGRLQALYPGNQPYGDGKASERILAALRGETVFEFRHTQSADALVAAAE